LGHERFLTALKKKDLYFSVVQCVCTNYQRQAFSNANNTFLFITLPIGILNG
jgi:hypothetical protein